MRGKIGCQKLACYIFFGHAMKIIIISYALKCLYFPARGVLFMFFNVKYDFITFTNRHFFYTFPQ